MRAAGYVIFSCGLMLMLLTFAAAQEEERETPTRVVSCATAAGQFVSCSLDLEKSTIREAKLRAELEEKQAKNDSLEAKNAALEIKSMRAEKDLKRAREQLKNLLPTNADELWTLLESNCYSELEEQKLASKTLVDEIFDLKEQEVTHLETIDALNSHVNQLEWEIDRFNEHVLRLQSSCTDTAHCTKHPIKFLYTSATTKLYDRTEAVIEKGVDRLVTFIEWYQAKKSSKKPGSSNGNNSKQICNECH